MVALSPTPSFPGAWPDLSLSDLVPPLPDKYISSETDTPEEDDSPQDISPSLHCLSPRPLPELPSLSSSLSTANSSVTDGPPTPSEQPCFPVEVQRFGTPLGFPNDSSTPPEKPCSPDEVQRTHTPLSLTDGAFTPPEEPCSPVEVRPSYMPLQTQLPIILDLREPHSPDTAHFSPPDDSISFPSPSSSHFRLSLSNNCSGARSAESVATFLPSPSRPSTPDGERGAFQEEVEGRPDPLAEEISNLCLQGDQEDHSLHAAKTPVGKRTFLSRVKRLGGRVRKLFKPRVAETKLRRTGVSLKSPRKPSLPVSVRLPAAVPESPSSRQGSDARHIIPRRFSLQSLLHPRLPLGSFDSSSRVHASNRLSTIVSAQEEDWPSFQDMHLPDTAAAEVLGSVDPETDLDRDHHGEKAEDQVPVTTETLHGLGIGAPESTTPVTATDSI
jgi:hypothetical protein